MDILEMIRGNALPQHTPLGMAGATMLMVVIGDVFKLDWTHLVSYFTALIAILASISTIFKNIYDMRRSQRQDDETKNSHHKHLH